MNLTSILQLQKKKVARLVGWDRIHDSQFARREHNRYATRQTHEHGRQQILYGNIEEISAQFTLSAELNMPNQ